MQNLYPVTKHIEQLHADKKNGLFAPHKPILLLAIMQLIEEGKIDMPTVRLTDELVTAFQNQWNRYVGNYKGYTCNIAMPFIHMHSEPFWQLISHEEACVSSETEKSFTLTKGKLPKVNHSVKAIRAQPTNPVGEWLLS